MVGKIFKLVFAPLFLLLTPLSSGFLRAQLMLPLQTNLQARPLMRQIDGNIYAVWGDRFTDTMDVYRLARYDGRVWTYMPNLCIQKGGSISDISICLGKVFVSGNFRLFYDPQYNCLATLENRLWVGMGAFTAPFGQAPTVQSLAVYNGVLYAGGRFTRVNGVLVNHLVSYRGVALEPVGTTVVGADGSITQMASRGADLAIAGSFRKINGVTAPGLAFFNGTHIIYKYTPVKSGRRLNALAGAYWYSGLDSNGRMVMASMSGFSGFQLNMKGLDSVGTVDGFSTWSGKVYALGKFYKSGSTAMINSVMLDDQTWVAHPVLSPNEFSQIGSLGNDLYLGGILNLIQGKSYGFGIVKIVSGSVLVNGHVFHDVNTNGKLDLGERALANRKLNISGLGDLFTDASGYYEFKMPVSGKTTITLEKKPGWKVSAPVILNAKDSPWIYQVNFPELQEEGNLRDMRVDIVSGEGWNVSRDAVSTYIVQVENTGQVSSSAKLEFQYNKKLSDLQVNPAPDFINTGKFTWNIANLSPGQTFVVNMSSLISSQQFEVGDKLGFHAHVIPGGTIPDENPLDNTDTLPQIITDRPTVSVEKLQYPLVEPGDTIAYLPNSDNVIEYVIRFENQGNDTVSQVQVIDTIDISLNMAYIRESGSSHPFSRKMILDPALPGKAILIFTFSNINLPPNTFANPEWTQSKGFFGLHIGLRSGNTPGTIIRNRAGILFDLQPSVLSNTVSCMLTGPNGLVKKESEAPGSLILYPNPTNGKTIIRSAGSISSVEVYDTWGRQILADGNISGQTATIDATSLKAGRYFIITRHKDGTSKRNMLVKL